MRAPMFMKGAVYVWSIAIIVTFQYMVRFCSILFYLTMLSGIHSICTVKRKYNHRALALITIDRVSVVPDPAAQPMLAK